MIPVPDIAEDEIADVGEHDGRFVVGGHVAGVEDVVVGEVALGVGWGVVSFGLVKWVIIGGGGKGRIPRIPNSRHRFR